MTTSTEDTVDHDPDRLADLEARTEHRLHVLRALLDGEDVRPDILAEAVPELAANGKDDPVADAAAERYARRGEPESAEPTEPEPTARPAKRRRPPLSIVVNIHQAAAPGVTANIHQAPPPGVTANLHCPEGMVQMSPVFDVPSAPPPEITVVPAEVKVVMDRGPRKVEFIHNKDGKLVAAETSGGED